MFYPISPSCQILNISEVYESIFGIRQDGFFVDVGAYDGFEFSNIWCLVEVGWSGICFEPVPAYYGQCKKQYKSKPVTVVKTAIGNTVGTLDMELAGASSSGSKKQLEIMHSSYLAAGFNGDVINVPLSTLDIELEKLNVRQSFELLSIDTEGMGIEVLEGFSIDEWKPILIVIETHKNNKFERLRYEYDIIDDFMKRHNYIEIQSDEVNSIYKIRPA